MNVNYRRIPILAHNRHLYLDSRHILTHLERIFPNTASSPTLTLTYPNGRALSQLLTRYVTDAGIFSRGTTLIPPTAPILQDPKFQADRQEFSGRDFSPNALSKVRAESLGVVRELFELLEELMTDGREWIVKTEAPSLADIEALWVVDWLLGMPGALPLSHFSERVYPHTFRYHARFSSLIRRRKDEAPKPVRVDGAQAAEFVLKASVLYEARHDATDHLGLNIGDKVVVWPLDSGSGEKNRDTGRLVGLNSEEVVLEKDNGLRVHAPRWGFRVVKWEGAKL